MLLKKVADVLNDYNLISPDLEMLRPNETQYTTLLMQPSGPITANKQRIGAFDQALASAKGKTFLKLAVDSSTHLAVTPEYFFPWNAISEVINEEIIPPEDALWVLGSESINQHELENFKLAVRDRCLVIHEPLEALSTNRELLSPVVLLFHATNLHQQKQLVALIQFKIHPSRDTYFFEESVLRRGSLVYQFKGIDSPLTATVIICADAFAFANLPIAAQSTFTNQSTLIHIQLNPKPRNIAYRKYRTDTFQRDPSATNCHIVSLNWAHSITQYETLENNRVDWGNIAGSTWYCPIEKCSFDDEVILPNHDLGLYYSYMKEIRHALLFHYDEAVFQLLIPKLVIHGSALMANRNGPTATERYEWIGSSSNWEAGNNPPDSGFSDLIQSNGEAQVALSNVLLTKNVLDIERVLTLSAGVTFGGEKWYEARNIDSCQIDVDEVVNRITVVQDTTESAKVFRNNRLTPIITINYELLHRTEWPPQVMGINNQAIITWKKTVSSFNVLTSDQQPTLIVYLGEFPTEETLKNKSDMFYELLRKAGGPYQSRLCIMYREHGQIKFAQIDALTRFDDAMQDKTDIMSV